MPRLAPAAEPLRNAALAGSQIQPATPRRLCDSHSGAAANSAIRNLNYGRLGLEQGRPFAGFLAVAGAAVEKFELAVKQTNETGASKTGDKAPEPCITIGSWFHRVKSAGQGGSIIGAAFDV